MMCLLMDGGSLHGGIWAVDQGGGRIERPGARPVVAEVFYVGKTIIHSRTTLN
jgi:hypothetical protein